MSSELFEALNLLEKERGIQVDFMVDKITKAILTACKNSYDNEDARVEVNPCLLYTSYLHREKVFAIRKVKSLQEQKQHTQAIVKEEARIKKQVSVLRQQETVEMKRCA